jgi:hypothetical protein
MMATMGKRIIQVIRFLLAFSLALVIIAGIAKIISSIPVSENAKALIYLLVGACFLMASLAIAKGKSSSSFSKSMRSSDKNQTDNPINSEPKK